MPQIRQYSKRDLPKTLVHGGKTLKFTGETGVVNEGSIFWSPTAMKRKLRADGWANLYGLKHYSPRYGLHYAWYGVKKKRG